MDGQKRAVQGVNLGFQDPKSSNRARFLSFLLQFGSSFFLIPSPRCSPFSEVWALGKVGGKLDDNVESLKQRAKKSKIGSGAEQRARIAMPLFPIKNR